MRGKTVRWRTIPATMAIQFSQLLWPIMSHTSVKDLPQKVFKQDSPLLISSIASIRNQKRQIECTETHLQRKKIAVCRFVLFPNNLAKTEKVQTSHFLLFLLCSFSSNLISFSMRFSNILTNKHISWKKDNWEWVMSIHKGVFQTCEAVTRQRKRDSESQRKTFSLLMILDFSNPT